MKRAVILLLLAALLLVGCAGQPNSKPYREMVDDIEFYVDPEYSRIVANGQLYTYTVEEGNVSVKYPNGAVCTENNGGIGWSNANQEMIIGNGAPYIDCDTLLSVVPRSEYKEKSANVGVIIMGLALCGLGIWEIGCPHSAWYVSRGWWYKDAEPSDMALGWIGATGIIGVVVGIILIIIGVIGI